MNQETIDRVRVYYDLPESINDKQIEYEFKGSLGEAAINLNIAKERLSDSLYSVSDMAKALERAAKLFKT